MVTLARGVGLCQAGEESTCITPISAPDKDMHPRTLSKRGARSGAEGRRGATGEAERLAVPAERDLSACRVEGRGTTGCGLAGGEDATGAAGTCPNRRFDPMRQERFRQIHPPTREGSEDGRSPPQLNPAVPIAEKACPA